MNTELPEDDGEGRRHVESPVTSAMFSIPYELRHMIYEELWPSHVPEEISISLNERYVEAALLHDGLCLQLCFCVPPEP